MKHKFKLFRVFYHLHIYGGLFASVFLLIVGISALNLQHHFIPTHEISKKEYSKTIHFEGHLNNDSLAMSIRDSLNVIGNTPKWRFREGENGNFAFSIFRPGRRYDISLRRNRPEVDISEYHLGIGTLLNGLHMSILGEPKSWMMILWAVYAQTAIVLTFFSIATSIYFWFKKSIRKKGEWLIVILASSISTGFILYVWLIG